MSQYELVRTDGWKLLYKDDPAFNHGEAPTDKVISYFCKRSSNEPEVDITKITPEREFDYDRVVEVSWLEERLKHTLRYKKKWYGDKDVYNFVVLLDYLDQCKNGAYKKCLLSSKELAILLPNKK